MTENAEWLTTPRKYLITARQVSGRRKRKRLKIRPKMNQSRLLDVVRSAAPHKQISLVIHATPENVGQVVEKIRSALPPAAKIHCAFA